MPHKQQTKNLTSLPPEQSKSALPSNSSPQREKTFLKHVNFKAPVSVHKTNVSPVEAQNNSALKDDIANHCPIHNKPHPLRKCHGFRLKTIEERKTYLKEQGICFKCCSSHLAQNCKSTLKCEECNSEHHLTALHPGVPPWATRTLRSPSEYGGESETEHGREEEKERTTPVVNSLCTEICGNNFAAKSCSKICLVKVYPDTLRMPSKCMRYSITPI